MRNKIIFFLVIIGAIGALFSAYVYAVPSKPLPPAFTPASNPFDKGIFANGIVESFQSNGENTNIYPEVPGTIVRIEVAEGQHVMAGTPLIVIDDSVQRAIVEQQRAQADAAHALLEELRAQPRRETLEVASAQVDLAAASLKSTKDTYEKQKSSYDLAPQSVSKDALDTAENAMKVATREPRRRDAPAQPHQSGRMGVRHQEPRATARSALQSRRFVHCAPRKIHHPSPHRRHRALDWYGHRQLRLAARVL